MDHLFSTQTNGLEHTHHVSSARQSRTAGATTLTTRSSAATFTRENIGRATERNRTAVCGDLDSHRTSQLYDDRESDDDYSNLGLLSNLELPEETNTYFDLPPCGGIITEKTARRNISNQEENTLQADLMVSGEKELESEKIHSKGRNKPIPVSDISGIHSGSLNNLVESQINDVHDMDMMEVGEIEHILSNSTTVLCDLKYSLVKQTDEIVDQIVQLEDDLDDDFQESNHKGMSGGGGDSEGRNRKGSGQQGGAGKQSQIAATLKWLNDNYERVDGVCLPRCVLYTHYLDLCKRTSFTPAGAATFGKIIRQRFPKLTTRRLGTRGQSKYHYYGIGIKETSIYYHSVYTGKGLTRFSGTKVKHEGSSRKYSLSSKTGTLLPEFPDVDNLILPAAMDAEKAHTFVIMYKTHCQRILDTVISANFEEIQNFLLHFWQGMPEHLISLLDEDVIFDVIIFCDAILYRVLVDVLIPTTIQDLPDSLCTEIKVFIKRLLVWLSSALEDVPERIRNRKLEVAKCFSKSIRRHLSFIQLAQTAREVLGSTETTVRMVEDLSRLDLRRLCEQAAFCGPDAAQNLWAKARQYFDELQELLKTQAPVESLTEWLDNIVDTCVLQHTKENGDKLQAEAAEFFLYWTVISSLSMRDLTLCSASTFGSFHVLRLMLDEYVMLVMETQRASLWDKELTRDMKRHHIKEKGAITVGVKLQSTKSTNSKNSHQSPKAKRRKTEETEKGHGERPTKLSKDHEYTRPFPENEVRKDYSSDPAYNSISCDVGVRGASLSSQPQLAPEPPSMTTPSIPPLPPLSPIKPISHVASNSFERHSSYFPHLPINSYPDYMPPPPPPPPQPPPPLPPAGGALSSPRLTHTIPDTHHAHAHQGINHPGHFTGSSLNMAAAAAAGTSPYWNDNRHHADLSTIGGYACYNKYPSAYESYSRPSSLYRPGPYQDGLSRSVFEPPSRSYYPLHQESFTAPSPFSMGSYGPNYLDIAHASTAQYGRQDMMYAHQEDYYPGNYHSAITPAHALSKSFVSPFR